MSLRLFLISIATLLLGSTVFSQILIDNTPTPTSLVQNTLIGPGLTTSNITFTGVSTQIGQFVSNGSNIGLDSGVVMSSGTVTSIPLGPVSTNMSGAGDADVLATAQSVTSNPSASSINATFDAAILEFDFVPTGDVVIFNFVFASEEYLTWINSQFNDAFGFYISGPIPGGGSYNNQNLALVPGTTEPITISTIYIDGTQTPASMNPAYFAGTNPIGHSFNGFSIPIEIRFDVICDSTYHFKFAVADCMDGILDTGVFLDGGSFQAVPVDLSLETNITSSQWGDSVIFEGCGTEAEFTFTRPSCQSSDSLWVDISIGGTATNGTDYALLPDSVLFLPGETIVIIPFFANQDGIFEGYESVIVTVTNILPTGDTIVTVGTIWLLDNLNVQAVAQDTTILCLQDSLDIFAYATDGLPPYSFVWESVPLDTLIVDTASLTVPGNPNGIYEYYVTVIDACGFTDLDTLTLTVNQSLSIDTTISFPSAACDPTGAVTATTSGMTGVPFYQWTGPGPNNPNFIDATVWSNLSPGWYYFSVTDDVCQANDSIFVDIEPPPVAMFSTDPQVGCSPLNVTFTNTSQNAVNYEWNFDGNVVSTTSTASQVQTFTNSAVIRLIAYDADGCSDTTYTSVNVTSCGCTDPAANNYDPNAIIDDGSCFYPQPIIHVPNVFTPNGDNQNDLFFIDVENATNLEFVILNRWGNVVYEASGLTSAWSGYIAGGSFAQDGTYFVKYVVTGIDGQLHEGHGFVQLIGGK